MSDVTTLERQETARDTAKPPLIEFRDLEKWYSGVHALKRVSLKIHEGETVGLVGDNGAGKTTLIKILSGVHPADAGEIFVNGEKVEISNPRRAMELGIETIYQYNSMVPTMTIARNVFIGREPLRACIGRFGVIDHARMRRESIEALADVDLHLRSPDAILGELSGGQRQGVAIARAMHFKSKALILDEPTNHLSVKETSKVLGFIRDLRHQQVSGVFISHNIHHVFECCERVVAMARGEIVFDRPTRETSVDEIQRML